MRIVAILLLVLAVCVWLVFGAFFIGYVELAMLPRALTELTGVQSYADLGIAYGAFSALLSPIALILGLTSIHKISSSDD